MAIGSTIFKAGLSIADMDRHYYETHELTLAQHPSETDERLMIRLIAFALNASERLIITQGVSGDDEPHLWEKNYGGDIDLWIELGQVDEKRVRKACGRAQNVIIYTYNLNTATPWWNQNKGLFSRFKNLRVIHLHTDNVEALCERSMKIQCNITDNELSFHSDKGEAHIRPEQWN